MAERVVERAVALRLAREVLAGLEVAPADLMAVADWLLSGRVADGVEARARFVRENLPDCVVVQPPADWEAGIVASLPRGRGAAGD